MLPEIMFLYAALDGSKPFAIAANPWLAGSVPFIIAVYADEPGVLPAISF